MIDYTLYYVHLITCAGIIEDANNSLFTYSPGESWSTFYSPDFVPVYETSFANATLMDEAMAACGTDPFCLFDVAATGSMDIGLSTLDGSINLEMLIEMAAPGKYLNSWWKYIMCDISD